MAVIQRLLCAFGWHGKKSSAGVGKLQFCESCKTVLVP